MSVPSLEEAFSRCPIALRLQIHINNVAILVYSPPQIVLLAVDFHEDFIDEEGVAVTSVLALQSAGINRSEFYAPETDCFTADGDAALGQEIFDISVAEIETIVEPDSVGDDVRRKSVTFVSIYPQILAIWGL